MKKHIIVVGGGMAGTAAAYTLRRKGHEVTIIEKSDRLGGRIRSVGNDTSSFELGAGFVTDVYTNTFAFLKANRMDGNLRPRKSQTLLIRDGRSYTLSLLNILRSKPFSLGAASLLVRKGLKTAWSLIGYDIHDVWRGIDYERSLSAVFKGHHGQEALDYFWQPVVEAYCYWNASTTSEAVMVWVASLLKGTTYSYSGGLQRIPEAAARGCKVLLSCQAESAVIQKDSTYILTIKDGLNSRTFRADGIVCAIPATQVIRLIKNLSKEQRSFFSSVTYSSTAVLARSYTAQTQADNKAFGYPRVEGGPIVAVTINTDTGAANTVVKTFASALKGRDLCNESDATILATLSQATPKEAILSGEATECIQRWPEAIPEFSARHVAWLKKIADDEFALNGKNLVFAGDYLIGPFIEGAFTSGVNAAERLDKQLNVIL